LQSSLIDKSLLRLWERMHECTRSHTFLFAVDHERTTSSCERFRGQKRPWKILRLESPQHSRRSHSIIFKLDDCTHYIYQNLCGFTHTHTCTLMFFYLLYIHNVCIFKLTQKFCFENVNCFLWTIKVVVSRKNHHS